MRTIQRDIVVALIISADGKILQGKKDPKWGGVYSERWHIPWGGIELGEAPLEALQRELVEEVGIDITNYQVALIDEDMGVSEKTLKDTGEKVLCEMKFLTYRVDMYDRQSHDIRITLSDDLVQYRWAAPSDLRADDLTPPSIKLFTRLGYLW